MARRDHGYPYPNPNLATNPILLISLNLNVVVALRSQLPSDGSVPSASVLRRHVRMCSRFNKLQLDWIVSR